MISNWLFFLILFKTTTTGYCKIDRNFIHEFHYDRAQPERTIVKSVIEIAHSLNLAVVAEGVETVEQESLLQSMSCDYVQGFYYAKPLSVGELKRKVNYRF